MQDPQVSLPSCQRGSLARFAPPHTHEPILAACDKRWGAFAIALGNRRGSTATRSPAGSANAVLTHRSGTHRTVMHVDKGERGALNDENNQMQCPL